jgi:predicted anti-sigma-YlaC factor YlaD
MNCSEAKAFFSEHLDGTLSKKSRAAMRRHLESCPNCRADCESIMKSLKILKKLKEVDAPRDYRTAASKKKNGKR